MRQLNFDTENGISDEVGAANTWKLHHHGTTFSNEAPLETIFIADAFSPLLQTKTLIHPPTPTKTINPKIAYLMNIHSHNLQINVTGCILVN